MQISRSMFYSLVSASLIGVGIIATGCTKGAKENQSTTEQQPTVEQLTNIYSSDTLACVISDLNKAQKNLNRIKSIAANYIYGESASRYANMSTEDLKAELKSNKKLVDDEINQRICNALKTAQRDYDMVIESIMQDQKKAELKKMQSN